jgi:hypothetical protein
MSISGTVSGEEQELINAMGHLFGGEPERAAPEPGGDLGAMATDFDAALRALNQRVAQQQRESQRPGVGMAQLSDQDRAGEREARQQRAHRTMREDIERMHDTLETGLATPDLDALVAFLQHLQKLSSAGRCSHALLPRARHAIAERLRTGAGELAMARLVTLLHGQGLAWPDAAPPHPRATPEEIEVSRRRRLDQLRKNFLTYDFARIAERLQGVVSGWGGDYPERGSPLWQESMLKGVAAALWAKLLQDCVELLKRKQKELRSLAETAVSRELAALQAAVVRPSASAMETTEAIASSLRVIDEVVPEIAWELVAGALPEPGQGFMD